MNLVLDTNIIISGIITPNGTISNLIFNNLKISNLICPEFLLIELINKFEKIKSITNLQSDQVQELIFRFTKRVDFIDDNLIENKYQVQAYNLIKEIDKKDLLFVALSIQTGYKLWTGDIQLIKGMREKGFDLVIDTKQLIQNT